MKIRNHTFLTEEHTYLMGILNVTPDSFSDGGKYHTFDAAKKRAEEIQRQGAHIIDVGGESTRPGFVPVSEEEEMERTAKLIEAIRKETDIPISIDTHKAAVAKEALKAGADLVNDIWGLKWDSHMAKVIAENNAICCLMHNRIQPTYQDFFQEVKEDLLECVLLAQQAGIAKENIILDPGVGFGKDYHQNMMVITRLEELKSLGYPLLLGASRKSVIGQTLDLPTESRLEGTLATTVFAVQKGCAFVRVHDIVENLRVIQMTEALLKYR